jgi:PadR family transcriptional regulator PadR
MPRMKHQELLKGLIRLHILHHASEAEFYGQWMI